MNDSVTFLGTSDGLPSADRYHASLLVRLGSRNVLLDCGEPCSHHLKKLGVDFSSIDCVIVTHTHSDHIAGFPMLVQSMWLEQRKRPLPVWLPHHAIKPLQLWLHACYLFDEVLPFKIQLRPLVADAPTSIGSVRFRAQRTTHLDRTADRFSRKNPKIGFEAFSLLLAGSGKRLAYSGDLGRPDDLAPLLTRPLDLLITELAHFHPKYVLPLLQAAPVRHVAFTHLGRPMRARFAELRAAAKRVLRHKQVSFPRDGDVIKLSPESGFR